MLANKPKQVRVFIVGVIIIICGGICLADGIKTYDRLVTTKGMDFGKVTVLRVDKDTILIRHSGGTGPLNIDLLPDVVRKDLGLPTRAEIALQKEEMKKKEDERRRLDLIKAKQALEAQARYDEEQRAKGLIKFQGQWLTQDQIQQEIEAQARYDEEQMAKGLVKYKGQWKTPVEIKEIEAKDRDKAYSARADELILLKFQKGARFKIIQSMPAGSLCTLAEWNPVRKGWYYTGETFFMLGATSKFFADGIEGNDDLYWAGTYTYTTVQNVEKTVNSYSYDRDLARIAVRVKFSLYDQQEPETTRPSPAIAGSEPILADTELKAFGSGFLITKDGFLLTNHHVVRKAKQVKVKTEKGILLARIVAQDPDNDIALLKIDGEFTPASFAAEKVAKLGQTVFTVGFPMPELQGFSPKVTKGVISSMNGIQDDVRMYQIDAAVQPGNSGGPLADENGNILGVVVARINDAFVAKTTGAIAQNVNYAVKKSYTMAFVDNQPDASKQVQTANDPKNLPFEEAVERIRKATVLVMVY